MLTKMLVITDDIPSQLLPIHNLHDMEDEIPILCTMYTMYYQCQCQSSLQSLYTAYQNEIKR